MNERDDWRVRPLLTAGIGLVAALLVQQLTGRNYALVPMVQPDTVRIALATAIGVAGVLAIFTLDRVRTAWAAGFALGVGVIAGLVTWWSGPAQGGADWFWDWRTACLFLAVAIAAPLFQTARDAGAARFDYREVHGHAWTNVVLWFAGLAFTGVSFALAFLLSELFQLIGLDALERLLRHDWATAMLCGGAFGGAVGLLRERDGVVRTLQRVVTAILAVLAPVLAVGLVLFLAALPFTGLSALWDATRATTPILLGCVVGALILANAVIGDDDADATANPVLRWAAIALGAVTLPLAIVAANAAGLRIGQYGFTPDRLWGLTFVIVASAYGLAYLVALRRGRARWAAMVRQANLRLAFALMGLALLLATPIVSFNAISTRDQVARLESGRIKADRFDWAALAFDFGAPGRAALNRLKRSSVPGVAALARSTATRSSRWDVVDTSNRVRRQDVVRRVARVLPTQIPLSDGLTDLLADWNVCGDAGEYGCVLLYRAGASEAVAVSGGCVAPNTAKQRLTSCRIQRLTLKRDRWVMDDKLDDGITDAVMPALRASAAAGAIEVREVRRRQVYIGDRPVGDVFE